MLFDENTILVQRTLRSGQSVSYDGNVVIMGDVNPGAEVIAAGDVIVIGSLRGVVHAGAGGDINAVVVAFKLVPTQLRIVDHITRAPDGAANTNSLKPEIASLKNGVVTIEVFQPR
ncbi:MAG: septum site-determining protein MinC [Desulfotomaculum sp.]|nr:septum site-determining protein MinC [Desulfotomaculum sp.]MCL0081497.1 septum site-determining protein MinC [Peptococcaceae bacterium]